MTNIIAVPFGYLMRFCYMFTNNYALALIFFTLFFKLILLPLTIKQHKSSLAQARVRPKERAIRKRYEGRTDQNARMELQNDLMKLYQEEKVSMAGGCLPLLIQFPIIIALWQVIQKPLSYLALVADETILAIQTKIYNLFEVGTFTAANTSNALQKLFTDAGGTASKFSVNQIQMVEVLKNNPEHFSEFSISTLPDFTLFGNIDLSQTPALTVLNLLLILPFLTAAFQYVSTLISQKFGPKPDTSTPEAQAMAKQMKVMSLIFPAMTLVFSFTLPAIISLYWIYQSIFSTIIQIVLYKLYPVPVYTEEECLAIEEEMNRDYVRPEIPAYARHSLHHIDDDDEYYDDEDTEKEDEEATNETSSINTENQDKKETEENVPPRRMYDKDGNKIRSLHYIDEDDE